MLPSFSTPQQIFSGKEFAVIRGEVTRLLGAGVIVPTVVTHTSYVSNIFTARQQDRSPRLILNLDGLSRLQLPYIHFKMDSMKDVIAMITPGVWLASIDLQDAYYSIPVHTAHQDFLPFYWNRTDFKFRACLMAILRHPLSLLRF